MHPKKISKILNKVIHTTAEKLLEYLPDNSIDLIVTSPPYGNLRDYHGFSWDFEKIAHGSYKVLKPGGVLVWVVGDRVVKRSETLEPMRQAIYFKDCVGFLVHDTMIYQKDGCPFPESNRYWQEWEYMLVFSKGVPKTIHLQKQRTITKYVNKQNKSSSQRNSNGLTTKKKYRMGKIYRTMPNIWFVKSGYMKSSPDKISYNHPATYPELLAQRHILTWSNKGDIVLDYFSGSGTTAKMAMLMARNYIGCDISKEYVDLANERLELYKNA
jgi:DNA modification methylase